MSAIKQYNAFRYSLPLRKRVQVIQEYLKNSLSVEDLANKFKSDVTQIQNIIYNQHVILKIYKKTGGMTVDLSTGQSKKLKKIRQKKVLSTACRNKVIHEYNYRDPKPTIASLATQYSVSEEYISDIIVKHETEEQLEKQRQKQIDFLGMVMHEYLQRVMYHNVPLDIQTFGMKVAEVNEILVIPNFKSSYRWLHSFKRKYGINASNFEALGTNIILKEVKDSSLDAGDLIRYVREQQENNRAGQLPTTQKGAENEQAQQSLVPVDLMPERRKGGRRRNLPQNIIESVNFLAANEGTLPLMHPDNLQIRNINGKNNDRCFTLKTEPESFEEIGNEASVEDQPIEFIIKADPSILPLNIDIKPNIMVESSANITIEENSKQCLIETPGGDVYAEDIKPVLITVGNDAIENTSQALPPSAPVPETTSEKWTSSLLTSPLPEIDSQEEAEKLLQILSNYALIKENYRAINLITQLENVLK